MKKITLVLVTLAFAAGMAVAEDVTLSVSGSATVEWGFAGQLIDNTGSFLDAEVASGDFYSSDDAGDLSTMDIPAFTFTMSVEDADGNVIVEAATAEIEITNELALRDEDGDIIDDNDDGDPDYYVDSDVFAFGVDYESVLDYISFPNVIPGILGITLAGDDALEPDYAPSGSASENERILINVTPIDQLDATVGLLIKPDNKLMRTFYDVAGTAATDGLFTWPDTGDPADVLGADADDFDDFDPAVILDANGWENGTYLSYALSLEATFTQELGEEDEISVGIGTVIDSAFTNGVYEPDYLVDLSDYTYSEFTDDVPLVNDAGTEWVIDEMYGPIAVNPLTMKEMDQVSFGGTDENKMLRTNEVLGRATIPVGVGIAADVAGISAAVDFQMVLTEGKDATNMTGVEYLAPADWDKSTHDKAAYAMPMYAAVDVGYELAVGDMTITPGVNFKYSSDAWKWEWDADDEELVYAGDVSGADFVGRPMSLDVGVDVEGIAGMIDVGISAALSLGDSVSGGHGLGMIPNFTVTDDAGVPETYVYDNTIADLIDYWYIQPTLADADLLQPAETATDGQNNGFFASTASAMNIELDISAEVIDGLTIANTTAYEIDNAGVGGADDMVLWGTQLSSLSNETEVTYDWMVGDAVAFTIFGLFTYESVSYDTEKGQKYIGVRTDTDLGVDTFEFGFSEAPSMATFDYAVGVRCEVGL